MKRIFYKIVTPIRRLYWFIVRPKTAGVKVIVECEGEVLMIKNTYGKGMWTFPGGAINRNESAEVAAKREVMEEVGVRLLGMEKIGELSNTLEYKRDTIHCYAGVIHEKLISIDSNEILEAQWFEKNKIPSGVSTIATSMMSLLIQ